MEMLVDPVLQCWVPKWVVEQYERRNEHFRETLEDFLRKDQDRCFSNRKLLLSVRREMGRRMKRSS